MSDKENQELNLDDILREFGAAPEEAAEEETPVEETAEAEEEIAQEQPDVITAPGIRELPLTLECKVVYQQDQNLSALNPNLREHSYPAGTVEENNFHTAYYGEITAAYILQD